MKIIRWKLTFKKIQRRHIHRRRTRFCLNGQFQLKNPYWQQHPLPLSGRVLVSFNWCLIMWDHSQIRYTIHNLRFVRFGKATSYLLSSYCWWDRVFELRASLWSVCYIILSFDRFCNIYSMLYNFGLIKTRSIATVKISFRLQQYFVDNWKRWWTTRTDARYWIFDTGCEILSFL